MSRWVSLPIELKRSLFAKKNVQVINDLEADARNSEGELYINNPMRYFQRKTNMTPDRSVHGMCNASPITVGLTLFTFE